MERSEKPTLKQVAALAEVSLATASMILNRKEGFSFAAETVSRVAMASKALGYGPAPAAASPEDLLKRKAIFVFLPYVTGNYYTTITRAVDYAAGEKGYDTLCFETYRDRERELRGLSHVGADIQGIIFTYIPHNHQLVEELSRTLPVVVIGNRNGMSHTDMVETDNYRAGMLLARHMLELGHRHVAFVGTTHTWRGYPSAQRFAGVTETFEKEGRGARLTVRTRPTLGLQAMDNKTASMQAGYDLAKECLPDRSITGFIAVNDYLAYGVIEALHERGLRVPQEYSVCGCDDIFASGLSGVNLTTVNHHIDKKGASAFELLYRRMNAPDSLGEEAAPSSVLRMEYLSTLMLRGSTAKPSRR